MNFYDFCYEFTHTESGLNQLLRNAFSNKDKKRKVARKLIDIDCPLLTELLGDYDKLANQHLIYLHEYKTDDVMCIIDFRNILAYPKGEKDGLIFHINNKKSRRFQKEGKKILMIYGSNWKCRIEKNLEGKLIAIAKIDKYHKDRYCVKM